MEKASGVNLEEKSGVGVPKAVRHCHQPRSGSSCDDAGAKLYRPCCSFGYISVVERGDVLHGQHAVPHIIPPRLTSYYMQITLTLTSTAWRGHSSFATGVDTTRGAADTGYKPSLNWRRAWRQGLLPTVGEIFGSQWTATARLKLGSPQPVRCCPATARSLHWVHGD